MIAAHPVWFLLAIACVLWYSTITVYVAVRGAKDIKTMLHESLRTGGGSRENRPAESCKLAAAPSAGQFDRRLQPVAGGPVGRGGQRREVQRKGRGMLKKPGWRRLLAIGVLAGVAGWLGSSRLVAWRFTRRVCAVRSEILPPVAWPVESHRLQTRDGQQIGAWLARGDPEKACVLLVRFALRLERAGQPGGRNPRAPAGRPDPLSMQRSIVPDKPTAYGRATWGLSRSGEP